MTRYFLDLHQVLHLHRELIERYGGSDGVRDIGLLQAAIAMLQVAFGGMPLHSDLFEMAAAYLFHIVLNHPFVDGNKRVGAACAIVFVAMNDIQIEADNDGLARLTIGVARGEVSKMEIAEFFRQRAR